METKVETTATATITTTDKYVETMHTGTYETINTDGAPVKRYSIGTNYTYGTHTYSIVGVRKYTGDAHSYWLVRFDSDPTTHEMTADKIKDYVGDDRKQIRNGSANDDKKATGTKRVPKTANETAAQIQTKYADTIKTVREKVGKLQDDDRITSALNLLCTMIETAANERIENVTNAEKAKRAERLERIARYSSVLPNMQSDAVQAMQDGNFDRAIELGKAVKEMQAELLLLQAEESAYLASIASEATETETAE